MNTYFDSTGEFEETCGDLCVIWSVVSTLVLKQFPIKKQASPKMGAPTTKPIIVQISENSFSQSLHAFIGNIVVKFSLNFLFEFDEFLTRHFRGT